MPVKNCKIIQLPKFSDDRGSLSVVENNKDIPFEIKRIYYMYENLKDTERGTLAHKKLQQLIISMNGSFDVVLDDGTEVKTFNLKHRNEGLFVCSMIWRELKNFSKNASCLVLASDFYNEDDYFRNYNDFLKAVNNK